MVPQVSSEAIHTEAIDELRALDFETFENFVIQKLAKDLDLKPSVFRRKCFTIHYTTEAVSNKGYQYCVLADDDGSDGCNGGCFRFFRTPARVKSIKYEYEPSDAQVFNYNFMRHLRVMQEFMLREENIRQEGIFLKAGSREMQQKLREKMQTSNEMNFAETGCTVYDCANVLKQILLQMSEPLFLSQYYPAYERLAKQARDFESEKNLRSRTHDSFRNSIMPPDSELMLKEQHLIGCLQLITHLMPHHKREIFKRIIEILEAVYTYRSFNRMSASALGAIFAPLIIVPRGLPRDVQFSVSRDMSVLVTKMVRIGKEVFDAPEKFRLQIWKYVLHAKHLDDMRPSIAPAPYFY